MPNQQATRQPLCIPLLAAGVCFYRGPCEARGWCGQSSSPVLNLRCCECSTCTPIPAYYLCQDWTAGQRSDLASICQPMRQHLLLSAASIFRHLSLMYAGQCVGGTLLCAEWVCGRLHCHRAGQVCCLQPCGTSLAVHSCQGGRLLPAVHTGAAAICAYVHLW